MNRDGSGGGLAVLAALIQTIGTAIAADGQPQRLNVLGYVLLAVSGLAVGPRFSNPKVSAFVVAGTTVAYHVMDYPSGPTFVAAAFAALGLMKAGRHGLVWGTAFV